MISIITATRNGDSRISQLYESLLHQTSTDFQWIVVDGLSTDNTVSLLKEYSRRSPWLKFISEADDGIYSALNKGIKLADGDYYVVAGDDDFFYPTAVENYRRVVLTTNADVIFSHVVKAGRTIGGFHPRRAWVGPSRVFAGSHSVGTLLKRNLHERFGLYSLRFPLLADAYFLKTLLRSRDIRFHQDSFSAGVFSEGGATSVRHLQLLAENWQIQMLTEPSPALQTLLFFGKTIWRHSALRTELHQLSQRNGVS
jgi:glycosyltransferase